MELVINGIKLASQPELPPQNVHIKDGRILAVGPQVQAAGASVVNGEGLALAPGFIDLHVHLRQPGYEGKETIQTGTAAGAAGGFTTLCAMPNLNPMPDSLDGLRVQLSAIEKETLVRVLPYGAITVGAKGLQLADIPVLAQFVAGFTDDGRGVQDEEMMRNAMEQVAVGGRFLAAHCEVENLIAPGSVCVQENSAFAQRHGFTGVSNESEWREVERDIRLAEETGCPLHICHTSTKESFELVRKAKARGVKVTCEATPHNLLLCCEDITENDGRFKMNPPLRGREDMLAAQQAATDGTLDAIATDHAPHTSPEKAPGFPAAANGVVGLETAFAACYTGLVQPGILTLPQLIALMTTGPASVLGEVPPQIAPGEEANLVLLDLGAQKTVDPGSFRTKGRFSPFAGETLKGWPVMTIYHGKIVYENEEYDRFSL